LRRPERALAIAISRRRRQVDRVQLLGKLPKEEHARLRHHDAVDAAKRVRWQRQPRLVEHAHRGEVRVIPRVFVHPRGRLVGRLIEEFYRSESVYRRYPIVSDSDLQDAAAKPAASAAGTLTGTIAASGRKPLR